jgi:hypothetical protein
VTIVQFIAARAMFDALRVSLQSGHIPTGFQLPFVWQGISTIGTLVGTAIVAVALHRVILFGDRKEGRFVHFSFGKIELLFALLPLIGFVIVLSLQAAAVATAMHGAAPLVLVGIVMVLALVFLGVRFSLIFPITVVEGQYDFGQAWALTRSNFWRIVWIIAFIPLALVFFLSSSVAMPFAFPTPGPGGMHDFLERAWSGMLVRSFLLSFPFAIASGALGVALLSYSYKVLSGRMPEDILQPRTGA